MKKMKKFLAIVLAASMLFACFSFAAGAVTEYSETGYTASDSFVHSFYKLIDRLIGILGKVINLFTPGLNWTGTISGLGKYTPQTDFLGENEFDTNVYPEAHWSMGFADASLLTGLDLSSGDYYLAGSLEAFNGRTPTEIVDDQTVCAYAISDGVSGTVVHIVLDGYGIARGDVLEIRKRLSSFAASHGIIAVNVSVLHQHSCIDTLGLSAPLVPALLKNPAASLFAGSNTASLSGKNETFMENLFEKSVNAAMCAVNNMMPGTLSYSCADIGDYIYDKREPIVFDPMIHRIRFVPDDRSANEIWVCESGIHCVTFGAAPDVLSADFPYYLKQYVKSKVNADVVFIEGAELAITSDFNKISYQDTSLSAKPAAFGKALGDKLIAIDQDTELPPVLNIKLQEVKIDADNEILILAVREGLINSVVFQEGLTYKLITEIGYMELGNQIGVFIAPGEVAPEILWGGAASSDASWNDKAWNYPALEKVSGAQRLICFGLCNDQIGYVICDNDVRSYLTENEEITASSTTAASTLADAFITLVGSVK